MPETNWIEGGAAAAAVALLIWIFGRGDLSKVLGDAAAGIRNFRDRL